MTDRERILAVIEATGCFDQVVGKYAQGLIDGGMPEGLAKNFAEFITPSMVANMKEAFLLGFEYGKKEGPL